jgi:glycosyltransferase involved in cell wall biosynthesis
MAEDKPHTVLWWGRFDPDYSRNRILRQAFSNLGWRVKNFTPRISQLANLQANFSRMETPDLVWVPAFRQRDVSAAVKWATSRNIPLIFDPLISAYDKQVFEREKFDENSPQARKLLTWETRLLNAANLVIADTEGHADFFKDTFRIPREKISVIAVGAEERVFNPGPAETPPAADRFEVLFYGSFIRLQAPEVIIKAAQLCPAPVTWGLIGNGPERRLCEDLARGYNNIVFEPALPFTDLPARIRKADVLLGIFGTGDKAARVIPNKVYQSLACGKPVVTRRSNAYPTSGTEGLMQITAGDPAALAEQITTLYENKEKLPTLGISALDYYQENFSEKMIEKQLQNVLEIIM